MTDLFVTKRNSFWAAAKKSYEKFGIKKIVFALPESPNKKSNQGTSLS